MVVDRRSTQPPFRIHYRPAIEHQTQFPYERIVEDTCPRGVSANAPISEKWSIADSPPPLFRCWFWPHLPCPNCRRRPRHRLVPRHGTSVLRFRQAVASWARTSAPSARRDRGRRRKSTWCELRSTTSREF